MLQRLPSTVSLTLIGPAMAAMPRTLALSVNPHIPREFETITLVGRTNPNRFMRPALSPHCVYLFTFSDSGHVPLLSSPSILLFDLVRLGSAVVVAERGVRRF